MSLTAAYDPNNILAKIVRGELPSVKVSENAEIVALMDIFPQSRGHILVVPKRSTAANLLDEQPSTLQTLIVEVQRLARAAVKVLQPDGVRIAQFNGAPAGQTIFHPHFHIIPVYEGASMARHGGGKAETAELEAIAAQIRAALQ